GEVAAVVRDHPDVSQCAVVVREDRPADRRLVAYLVPAGAGTVDVPEVRAYVAARLPHYMVPAALVVLDGLPVTASGKLDRRALPAPTYTPRTASRAPATAAEEAMCAIFAAVLDIETVGVDDNFFELGGDSVLATRLAGRLSSDLGVDV